MTHSTPAKDGQTRPDGQAYDVAKDESDWKAELNPQEYHVLREAGTEAPFVGEYTDTNTEGVYRCRACSAELFRSDTKFDSHCGWPSFYAPLAKDSVVYLEDRTLGGVRTEVRCAACGGHLGHVFEGEGYGTPTDLRYCINSISMKLEPVVPSATPAD
jgi:peptide-methionine (R)-S-oxide reductase